MSPDPTNGNQGHQESARAHARSARSHASEAGTHAAAAATEFRDAAEEAAQEIRDRLASLAGDLKAHAKTWQSEADRIVRANPTRSILTAVGVGFVLGALFRR